jgi:hypothetical protein
MDVWLLDNVSNFFPDLPIWSLQRKRQLIWPWLWMNLYSEEGKSRYLMHRFMFAYKSVMSRLSCKPSQMESAVVSLPPAA